MRGQAQAQAEGTPIAPGVRRRAACGLRVVRQAQCHEQQRQGDADHVHRQDEDGQDDLYPEMPAVGALGDLAE
mgnify:CR=1 FL=1